MYILTDKLKAGDDITRYVLKDTRKALLLGKLIEITNMEELSDFLNCLELPASFKLVTICVLDFNKVEMKEIEVTQIESFDPHDC